ncbi:MAG: PAS-domain containing protein [Pseudomonadota bacterium]
MPSWLVIALTGAYVCGLFWIAHTSERGRDPLGKAILKPWLFGLSIAVYCTSWTYYGAVGTAAASGWDYLPIYLGPMLVFAFGGGLLKKLVKAGKAHHVTSIADFISARYGKSQRLAAMVTLIAVVGALPYIALQLKSIAMTFSVVTGNSGVEPAQENDLVLLSAGILALFALVFGTRHADITTPNRGLVRAIVIESALKLFALVAVGALACAVLWTGGAGLNGQNLSAMPFQASDIDMRFWSLTLLSIGAVLCLPRQFHMLVVECTDPLVLPKSRWVFVGYLALTALVVPPIALAGITQLPVGTRPDLFVLLLPSALDQSALALLTFLGGFAAATGMVIVACVALSIMVTNDLVIPILLKLSGGAHQDHDMIARRQRVFRRFTIAALMLLAYGFDRSITEQQTLAALGILSFAAAVQFMPALVGGLYWSRGNKRGVFTGLVLGFALWLFTLVLPAIAPVFNWAAQIVDNGLFGLSSLRPEALFGFAGPDPLTHGLFWSLGVNALCFVIASVLMRSDGIDLIQAAAFSGHPVPSQASHVETSARVKDLRALIQRSLGRERCAQAFEAYELLSGRHLADRDLLDDDLVRFGEMQLTRVLGASSSRLLLQSILSGTSLKPEDVVTLLDETSQKLEFNRELLQATLENIPHGVCVVDRDMRIAAWNTPYVDLFDYPDQLVSVGRPIADIIRYNAEKGTCPGQDADRVIARRVGHMQAGRPHDFSRRHFDGRYLEIQGQAMPDGGYITTYMDVTARVRAETALKETNETLEQRVLERTHDLKALNEKLERATASKTRFLAAASHDLLQPLNAARLFTSALSEDVGRTDADTLGLLQKIDQSIASADTLLRALLNMSKLDSDSVPVRPKRFAVADLLQELVDDFSVIAKEKGLTVRYVPSTAFIRSDRALLRSVLQNFLSNAVRYTKKGGILVGCRLAGDNVRIVICDTGVGIDASEQAKIFQEFHQVQQDGQEKREGVGLGLAIVQRIAQHLDHPIRVNSVPGRGSAFEIIVPRTQGVKVVSAQTKTPLSTVGGLRVFCIDNDPDILSATTALLSRWNCIITGIQTAAHLAEALRGAAASPDLVLLDYQLDDGATGFEYLDQLVGKWGFQPPVILMTAAQESDVETEAHERGVPVLRKPIAPAQLRALIRQTCQVTAVAE